MTPQELIDHRKELGLTQSQMAELTGYSLSTVKRWHSGQMEVPKAVSELLKIKVAVKKLENF